MSHAVVPGRAVRDRPHQWQRWLAARLVPSDAPKTRWFELLALYVFLAVATFFRFGAAAVHARVWAEDGKVFLQEAARHGRLQAVPDAYAGYGHLVPRLVAAVVVSFPVRWWGGLLHVADALVVAALATVVYLGLANVAPRRAPRAVAACYFALVPVGPEVVGSIANLQWYLIVAAVVMLFWTPQQPAGWVVQCVTVFVAVTSSPIGGLVLVAAVVRVVVQGGRGPAALAITCTTGVAIQAVIQALAPPRELNGPTPPGEAVRGYVSRVAGDGVLGIDRWIHGVPVTQPGFGVTTSVTAGVCLLIVTAVVVVLAGIARWRSAWLPSLVLFLFSVAIYAVAVISQRFPLNNVQIPGRYYVSPALLLVVALLVLVGSASPPARRASVPAPVALTSRLAVPTAAAVLVGCLAFAIVTSFNEARLRGRNDTTTWAAAVRAARVSCREPGATGVAHITILPTSAPWIVTLPCSRIR